MPRPVSHGWSVARAIAQDLDRLLALEEEQRATTLPELDATLAMGSLHAIVAYLDLLGDEAGFGKWRLSTFNFSQVQRLRQTRGTVSIGWIYL
jgi:hypothetical protein